MLVLTRKLNEVISIGGLLEGETPIEVTVIEVRGDQVRLGITAPGNVQVHRKEIWLEIKQNSIRASLTMKD